MSTSSGDSGSRQVGTASPLTHHETAGLSREVRQEPREVRQETVVHETEHHERPVTMPERPVNVAVPPERRDQVRWGPVWAGLVVALSTFLLLELLALALRWIEPGSTATRSGVVSGILGLIAFFLGGLVAGATAMWRDFGSGLLHGVLVWALGVVSILLIATLGGGALFGSVADTLARVGTLTRTNLSNVDASAALSTARSAAGWGVLGLALSLAAAALGGLMGAKAWPRKRGETHRSV